MTLERYTTIHEKLALARRADRQGLLKAAQKYMQIGPRLATMVQELRDSGEWDTYEALARIAAKLELAAPPESEGWQPLRVALSQYHAGQMVPTIVSAEQRGVWVRVTEDDHTITFTEPDFHRNIALAEAWLKKNGIHLDAQGIY